MFTDLLLAVTLITGIAPDQALANPGRTVANAAPSCMAGPVRVRFRKPNGGSQIASAVVRQEAVYARAGDSVRPE